MARKNKQNSYNNKSYINIDVKAVSQKIKKIIFYYIENNKEIIHDI